MITQEEEERFRRERNEMLLYLLKSYPTEKVKLPQGKFLLEESWEKLSTNLERVNASYVIDQMQKGYIVDLTQFLIDRKMPTAMTAPPVVLPEVPSRRITVKALPKPTVNEGMLLDLDLGDESTAAKQKALPTPPPIAKANVYPLPPTRSDSVKSLPVPPSKDAKKDLPSLPPKLQKSQDQQLQTNNIYPAVEEKKEFNELDPVQMTQYVMSHTNTSVDYAMLAYSMSEDELCIASYETFLLSCGLLSELSPNELTSALSLVRTYCKISHDDHKKIMADLILNPTVLQSISFSTSPAQYQKQAHLFKSMQHLFSPMKSLLHRWELVKSYQSATGFGRTAEFFVRQAKVFVNGFLLLLKEKEISQIPHNHTHISYPDVLRRFEVLISCFADDPLAVAKQIDDIDKIVREALKLMQIDSETPLSFPYPINVKLYEFLIDTKVLHVLKTKSSDNDLDVESDEDIVDEDDPISEVLAHPRNMLAISNVLESLCFINSLCDFMESCDSYLISKHLEQQIIRELEYFSQFSDDDFDDNATKHRAVVFNRLLKIYGQKLTDIFDVYTEDIDLMKEHDSIFTCLRQSVRFMIRSSVARDYIRMRDSRIDKVIKKHQKLDLDEFEDMGDRTAQHSDRIDLLHKFADEYLEELQFQSETFYPAFDIYFKNTQLEATFMAVEMFSRDIMDALAMEESLTRGVMILVDDLKKFYSFLNDQIDDDNLKLGNRIVTRRDLTFRLVRALEPLSAVIEPAILEWISKWQEKFTIYLDRSVQLDKFEAMSDDIMHSSSLVDLFTFLQQPVNDLYTLALPNMSHFYRAYAQCVSGIVQRYCHMNVRDIPAANDLIPSTPKIPKPKTGLLKLTQNKKSKETQEQVVEENRLRLGQKFGYEELFVRLNNLSAARKKFISFLEEMKAEWNKLRDLLILGADQPEKTKPIAKAADSDSDTDTDSDSEDEQPKRKLPPPPKIQVGEKKDNTSDLVENVNFESTIAGTGGFIISMIQDLCEYIGTRNIYIELYPMFSKIYLPTVESRRLDTLLHKQFDPCMESLCDSVSDGFCSELVMKAMFRKLMRAMYHIVLEGGPERVNFKSLDAPIILKDIEAIEKFFYASGEGIKSKSYVKKYTGALKSIVGNVMDKTSQQLIAGSDLNERFEDLPERQPAMPESPWTKYIVFRVLYHRIGGDPVAKKWFEKHKLRYD